MLKEIQELHAKLKPKTEKIPYSVKTYRRIIFKIDKMPEYSLPEILSRFKSVEKLFDKYDEIMNAEVMTPDVFDNLTKMFDDVQFPEQGKIRVQKEKIRVALNAIYRYVRRVREDEKSKRRRENAEKRAERKSILDNSEEQ